MNTTITRNIMGNDITINLTEEEIRYISNDFQIENDKAEVISRLENSDTEYEIDDIPEELIENIAKDFRKRIESSEETKMDESFRIFYEQLEQYERKDKIFTVTVQLSMETEYKIRAKDEDEAEQIFTAWSERNSSQMTEDLTEDAEYVGRWDIDGYYEDYSYDLEDADITREDV